MNHCKPTEMTEPPHPPPTSCCWCDTPSVPFVGGVGVVTRLLLSPAAGPETGVAQHMEGRTIHLVVVVNHSRFRGKSNHTLEQ